VTPTGSEPWLVERLRSGRPLLAVELRPPLSTLSLAESREAWIDANHALRRLAARDTLVFVTDRAVGAREEENLQHLVSNVGGDADPSRIVPFLTCKHTLDYCLWYAQRAVQSGFRGLVVLGGDRQDGFPRCVPHAWQLRREIRGRAPQLALGGWANPHRDPGAQLGFLNDPQFEADYFLTQVVSHHDLPAVERFLREAEKTGSDRPAIFGVFYYRSASPRTLAALSSFLPVPREGITADFGAGLTAEQVCARTIEGLHALGVRRFYVSNLPTLEAPRILGRLARLLEER